MKPTKPDEVIPCVRTTKSINSDLPEPLKTLYYAVMSTEQLVIKSKYQLTHKLVDWGTESLVFLGNSAISRYILFYLN